MEIKNKLTVTRGEGGGDQQGKEGEGSSQETCIKDPRTETMGGMIEYRRQAVGKAGESNWGKMVTTVIEQQ